jgi:hypothetical protein
MPHFLPYFYVGLLRVEAVEGVNGGEAMKDLPQAMKDFLRATKDFLQMMAVATAVLALFMGIRFALYVPLHNETIGVEDPAPIAATGGGRAVRRVKMPCFWQANPQGGATAPVPHRNGSARALAIESQDIRCPVRQVKFPCLQSTDPRS